MAAAGASAATQSLAGGALASADALKPAWQLVLHPPAHSATIGCARAHRAAQHQRIIICAVSRQPPGPPLPPSDSGDNSEQGPGIHSTGVPRSPRDPARFRFWIDFQVLSSPQSTKLLERALRMVGGVCTGGPPKLDPETAMVQKHKDYGYMHMGDWDFLWSITAKAMLAAEILRPGQLVSIIPGFLSITRKTSLVSSLRLVYGDTTAFQITPRTFKLPDEMDAWEAWSRRHPEVDLWMLKNNKQRGTGLRLVRTRDAFKACFETTYRPGLEGMKLYRWYLAQQYIADPMLLNGCKFGLRVWALVPGVRPLRAYVHKRGLVLLSSHKYDRDQVDDDNGSGVAMGHVTNYAQNENGDVWSLAQYAAHVGQRAFHAMWERILDSVAMVLAAALPRINEVQSYTCVPPQSTFQFFGFDYLVDQQGKPWLMEANATPSMKVEHEDPRIRQLIHDEKWPVVMDMVHMLGVCPERFNGPSPQEYKDIKFLRGELARRGGFVPIMHRFPKGTPDGLRTITWHALDHAVRQFCSSKDYQAALQA